MVSAGDMLQLVWDASMPRGLKGRCNKDGFVQAVVVGVGEPTQSGIVYVSLRSGKVSWVDTLEKVRWRLHKNWGACKQRGPLFEEAI